MDRRSAWLRGATSRLGLVLVLALAPACAAEPGAHESTAGTVDPPGWVPQDELFSTDQGSHDYFGDAVAISGDTLVVGARYAQINGLSTGAAYVFVRSGARWILQAKLLAEDRADNDSFGFCVALSGDLIVVGAFRDDTGNAENSGSAYVFERSGTTWKQQAKLLAEDRAAEDKFGYSVAVSGDTIVVGARYDDESATVVDSGSAYVFERSGTSWTQQAKLLASDRAAGDQFGHTVAVAGDTIVVGALDDDDGGVDSGSAYIFERSGKSWIEQPKLLASDRAAGDQFGRAVAVAGDTIVVGAFGDDDGKLVNSGSAYVFERSFARWSQQAKLVAAGSAGEDSFGFSVAVSGDAIVVGALFVDGDGAADSGAAYVFERSLARWSQQAKLLGAGRVAQHQLGYSVGISGASLVVGATSTEVEGSAHVFVLHRDDGDSCTDATQCLSGVCTDTVCGPGSEKSYYSCAAAPGRGAGSAAAPLVVVALALVARSRRRRPAARP